MEGTPIHDLDAKSLEHLIYMVRTNRIQGLTVQEAALQLGVSTRTVFRWLKEGKVEGEKWKLSQGIGYFWLINPMSIAKILVRKEVEEEMRKELDELERLRALVKRRKRAGQRKEEI